MSNIVLTGGTGFVGRPTTAALLASGARVLAVTRDPGRLPGGLPDGVTAIGADLLGDPASLYAAMRAARPEVLVHAAWSTEHGRYWTDPRNRDWTARTLCLVEAFVEAGGRRVVTVGTCAEYEWSSLGTDRCREASTPLRPHTLYGSAKQAAAQGVADYCRSAGVGHAHARLFMLFGAGEQPERLVPATIRSLLAGRRASVTSGRQIRDFLDVRDAGAALAALAQSGITGAINVASGQPLAIGALVATIAAAIGRPDLLGIGDLSDRPDDPPYLVADIDRLTHELGFRPGITLRRGLNDAIEHWRAEALRPPDA